MGRNVRAYRIAGMSARWFVRSSGHKNNPRFRTLLPALNEIQTERAGLRQREYPTRIIVSHCRAGARR